MIKYKVEWTEQAYQNLTSLYDEKLELLIKERVENHLASHLFQNGIPMKGKLKNAFQFQ